MRYVLCYWYGGQYNYQDIEATSYKDAQEQATGWLEDNCIEAYMRNEWGIKRL